MPKDTSKWRFIAAAWKIHRDACWSNSAQNTGSGKKTRNTYAEQNNGAELEHVHKEEDIISPYALPQLPQRTYSNCRFYIVHKVSKFFSSMIPKVLPSCPVDAHTEWATARQCGYLFSSTSPDLQSSSAFAIIFSSQIPEYVREVSVNVFVQYPGEILIHCRRCGDAAIKWAVWDVNDRRNRENEELGLQMNKTLNS